MHTGLLENGRQKHRRQRAAHPTGLSFSARIMLTFSMLLVTASFVIIIAVIAVRGNHTRRGRTRSGKVFKPELEQEIPVDTSQFNFEERTFDPKKGSVFYCNGQDTAHYHAILFTCLPDKIKKQETSIAENTFKTWSSLKPHVKPILYITQDVLHNQINARLVDFACSQGIQVVNLQNNGKENYPILSIMFEASYALFNVTWYGYADYRQIFDSSLDKSLRMIEYHPEILGKGNFVVGRSHQFELETESLSPDFPDLMDLGTLVQELYYFDATEEAVLSENIHYFFTTKKAFPWGRIPALIVGSELADQFLMWYTMKNSSILAVDATDAIFTLRQYYMSEKNKTKKEINSMKSYNEALISKWKYPLYYKKGLGTVNCLEYKLTNNEMPYYVLLKRTRKYIRRVTRTKPASLSYYCKIVKTERVALIDNKGTVKDCNLVNQLKYLDMAADD